MFRTDSLHNVYENDISYKVNLSELKTGIYTMSLTNSDGISDIKKIIIK